VELLTCTGQSLANDVYHSFTHKLEEERKKGRRKKEYKIEGERIQREFVIKLLYK
jgi:hypothetical protein